MFGVRKTPNGCNFVHSDEIWKAHVRRELQASRRWPEKFGTASNETQSRECPETNKLIDDHKDPRVEGTSVESEGTPQQQQQYPQTTAREVGWRHSHFKELEMYGKPARGKLSIDKHLKWPKDSFM